MKQDIHNINMNHNAYLLQSATRAASIDDLTTLRDLERRSGKVTLFCHERQPPCHRFLLLDLLTQERV
jgi:hypothetical protein